MESSEAPAESRQAPRVFISWSGEGSRALALALDEWIRLTIQGAECFVSDKDVRAGSRWLQVVGEALGEFDTGIICVTPENLNAPWLLFEAGALSKNMDRARVIPVLLGFGPERLEQPLSQFQACEANESGIRAVFESLAAGLPINVDKTFQLAWGDLEAAIQKATEMPGRKPAPALDTEAMLVEIMTMLRGLETAMARNSARSGPLHLPALQPTPFDSHRTAEIKRSAERVLWLTLQRGDYSSAKEALEAIDLLDRAGWPNLDESLPPVVEEPPASEG